MPTTRSRTTTPTIFLTMILAPFTKDLNHSALDCRLAICSCGGSSAFEFCADDPLQLLLLNFLCNGPGKRFHKMYCARNLELCDLRLAIADDFFFGGCLP